MDELMTPPPEAIFYEDDRVYACLASFPDTVGHSVVVWKERKLDLHELVREEYEHLMDVVDMIRNAQLATLGVEKVYLVYMDETMHVHWHLVPRYKEMGATLLMKDPKETHDFKLAFELKAHIEALR